MSSFKRNKEENINVKNVCFSLLFFQSFILVETVGFLYRRHRQVCVIPKLSIIFQIRWSYGVTSVKTLSVTSLSALSSSLLRTRVHWYYVILSKQSVYVKVCRRVCERVSNSVGIFQWNFPVHVYAWMRALESVGFFQRIRIGWDFPVSKDWVGFSSVYFFLKYPPTLPESNPAVTLNKKYYFNSNCLQCKSGRNS